MFDEMYTEILGYFKVNKLSNDLFASRSYVSVDNIHDAIISIGFNDPDLTNKTIIKAKQKAINQFRDENRRYSIMMEHINDLVSENNYIDTLSEYDFSEEELIVVKEIIKGTPAYKSQIKRSRRKTIIENIKRKLLNVTRM